MRISIIALALTSVGWSQSMLENAAIVAGSTAGSVAGKQISNGLTNILEKAGKQGEKIATEEKKATPLLQVGPGAPKQQSQPGPVRSAAAASSTKHYNVPPPPPLPRTRQETPAEPELPVEPEIIEVTPPPPPPPPPPVMTAEQFATLTQGMHRDEVLGMGRNAVRIVITQSGHIEEIYHYREGGNPLGVVRIVDGRVAAVDRQP